MIKIALVEDLDIVISLVEKFLAESPYEGREIQKEKLKTVVYNLLSSPNHKSIILLSLLEEKVIGFVGLTTSVLPFSDMVIAQELSWYIDPDHRLSRAALELFDAAEFWAKQVGAGAIQFSSLATSPSTVEKFYNRKGYVLTEKAFLKWI